MTSMTNLLMENRLQCDVLVIGTEGTGVRAALEAAQHGANVLTISKGIPSQSGATLTAGGEISIDSRSARDLLGMDGSAYDSAEQFACDMIQAGEYLPNQKLVAIHTAEAPARIKELVDWGARLEGFIHGPGHKYPRGIWIPGVKIARLLAKRLRAARVPVLANIMALEILRDGEGVVGILALDIANGKLLLIQSRVVILATGGAMRIFPLVTAPEELTGDGMAMALRCGATLQDMEFPMFLPYCFITPPALRGVTFSYDISAMLDVHALNRYGNRYMAQWDSKHMEHSTRDVNAVAATVEIQAGRGSRTGGTYLSFAHLPRNLVRFSADWFPANRRNWQADGFNLHDFFSETDTDSWEVAPACHFWNGGIRIDERCATEIPGLFAAGEGTAGIHGANRLSGNGLTMTQVWGKRAGFYACKFLHMAGYREPNLDQVEKVELKVERLQQSGSGPTVIEFRNEIRRIASQLVGIVREHSRLEQALTAINTLREELPRQHVKSQETSFNREWVEALQNENQLDVLEAIVRSSLVRRESRGAMYRSDYPETDDDNGLYNVVLGRNSNLWTLEKKLVIEDYVSLPHGKRKYGNKGDFGSG